MFELVLDALPRALVGGLIYSTVLLALYLLGDIFRYRQLVRRIEDGKLQTQETQAAGQGSSSGKVDSAEVVD